MSIFCSFSALQPNTFEVLVASLPGRAEPFHAVEEPVDIILL
jgi:hypothetical protein